MPTAKHALKVQGVGRTKPDLEVSPNYMQNAQGMWLHWRMFSPFDPSGIKAILVLCHGLAEHHGRYEGVAEWLNKNGYLVFMLEHQGHGASEGDRKHVERFQHYIDDQEQFVKEKVLTNEHVAGRFSHCPKVLFGHSMGGLIAVNLALRMQTTFVGLCLTGPLLGLDEKTATPFLKNVAGKLSYWSPKFGVGGSLDVNAIASNPLTREHYSQDPLVAQNAVSARWGAEVMETIASTEKAVSGLKMPVSVHHGADDTICNVEGSKTFIKEVASQDKNLKFYPGLRHEILNETKEGRDEVKRDVLAFLDRVVGGTAATSAEETAPVAGGAEEDPKDKQ